MGTILNAKPVELHRVAHNFLAQSLIPAQSLQAQYLIHLLSTIFFHLFNLCLRASKGKGSAESE